MTALVDSDGRALRDLVVETHPGEAHLGVSVPAGQVVPAHLRAAVEAMAAARPPRRGKGS